METETEDINRIYAAIDLKSFFASVECMERGLDPLEVNLVVADNSKTEKTICLAVTPSLKSYGIPGRPRLYEVITKVKYENNKRRRKAPRAGFSGKSYYKKELDTSPSLEIDFIIAPPQMAKYVAYSTQIYGVYLKYFAAEDIHVYSIDEVFIDLTNYLETYDKSPEDLVNHVIQDVIKTTGITATAGVGTNLYLAKIAMDIMAKKQPSGPGRVSIAYLDEMLYRKTLWNHRPVTSFWRVGRGYQKKLEAAGLYTMGDIARASLKERGEDYLYKAFGVNAELLIDHAWGHEPCTMADIRGYKPENRSLGSGQVLQEAYDFEMARLVLKEMLELLSLDLVEKSLVTDQIVLTVGYDAENLTNPKIRKVYRGEITKDVYGRPVPKHARATANLGRHMSSTIKIIEAVMIVYDRAVNKNLLIRRINISANNVLPESEKPREKSQQLDMFSDFGVNGPHERDLEKEIEDERRERRRQKALIKIQKKYGKNAVLKGMNLEDGATSKRRNQQIGGHKA